MIECKYCGKEIREDDAIWVDAEPDLGWDGDAICTECHEKGPRR